MLIIHHNTFKTSFYCVKMETGLNGRVAIITGGASGIGKSIVEKLSDEGVIPIFVDKNKEKGDSLSEKLSEKRIQHLFLFYDLTNDSLCEEAILETIRKYGRLDILINNAGINDRCDIDTTSPNDFRRSLDVNLVHYYAMTHFAWPYLKQSRGNILFIGSKVSLVGEGKTTAYAAAKGAINGMTRELATKSVNENLGIRVNCLLPGIVRTPLCEEYMISTYGDLEKGSNEFGKSVPLNHRLTTSEEIANSAIFLVSDLASHMTGQLLVNDGGYCHIDRRATEK